MPQHYLGIDIGTTAIKAMVVDEFGSVAGVGESPLEISVPMPGWAEQDPSDWWQGTVKAVRAACIQANVREVTSIGLSGQMHSSVLLDKADRMLRPAILWNDVRTTAQCRFITDKIGKPGLRRLVGNPALEGFTAPKLLWMRDEEPHLFERARTLLLPKDYVRLAMTGEKAFGRRRYAAVRRTAELLVGGDDRGATTRSFDSPACARFHERDRWAHRGGSARRWSGEAQTTPRPRSAPA